MDKNPVGCQGCTDLSRIPYFCIREYVAEIRKVDWKKCCPFELSGNSEVDNVAASLVLEADNVLVNTIPEDTEAPNASEVGNAEVHEARSENPNTDEIIGDDAAENTIIGETSAAATIRANDIAQGQNVTNVAEDAIVAENDKPQDPVIADNAAETISIPLAAAGDDDAIAYEIDKDTVIGNDAVNTSGGGSLELVSNEVNNAAPSQNGNRIAAEDAIATGNDQPEDGTVPNNDGVDALIDGSSDSFSLELINARCQNERNTTEDSLAPQNNRRRRNLAQRKPHKFRRLADIYKELGSCIYASEDKVESEFTAESSEDDSDEVTLGTFIRGKRSVRANSKRIDALKNKRKTRQDAEPRLDKGKRAKSVSEDNRGNDSELGSKYYLRRNRINEPDLQMTNKRKEFPPEDSLLSRGHRSNSEAVQEDCAREVLKLLDGNQRRFTEEENHSGPSRGVKRAQHLVQSPTAVSMKDVGTASSGRVNKRIRESSPPSDNETMAVLQLLRLSNAWVNSKSPSKNATEDAPLSAADHESPLGLDAPLSAADRESPLGLDAPLSAADRENPLGLDAPLSAADSENPLGLDAPLSAADRESPLGLDAPLSVADSESLLGLDAPLSAADRASPLGLDGVAPPASGSMVSKPPVEVNVIDGAGLPDAEKTKPETFVCRVSRNPAEFSIPNAKKFMRRGKAVKTV